MDLGVCIFVCIRDTRHDQCQHVELIRLAVTSRNRDVEKEGGIKWREREKKQFFKDEVEDKQN